MLERRAARTARTLFARIAVRLLTLAACIALNHQLGPGRAIANYAAAHHVASAALGVFRAA